VALWYSGIAVRPAGYSVAVWYSGTAILQLPLWQFCVAGPIDCSWQFGSFL